MSSFYIQNKAQTISGAGLFNIKLDHKFSNFNPNAQPAIDIESLNSGLYVLRRLSSVIEAGIPASSLLNPNNTIFPINPPTKPKNKNTKSVDNSSVRTEQAASLRQACAVQLINKILDGLQTLIDTTPDVNMAQVSSISLAIALVNPLKDKDTLTEAEQTTVFTNCYEPSKADILDVIKKQYADEIEKNRESLQARIPTNKSANRNYCDENYPVNKDPADIFAEEFFDKNVKEQFMTYRNGIGSVTSEMMQSLENLFPEIPEITKDNITNTNGMILLQAIFKGLTDAVEKAPELGGNEEVIKLQLEISKYLTQTTFTDEELKKIYKASDHPSKGALDLYLKPSDVAIYRQGIISAYQTMVTNLSQTRSSIEKEKKHLENQLDAFERAVQCYTDWVKGSTTIANAAEHTSEIVTAWMEALAGLGSLSQMYKNLTTEEQAIFDTHVAAYKDLTVKTGSSVKNYIAKMLAFQEVSNFTLNNAIEREDQVKTYVGARGTLIKALKFFEDVGAEVNTISNTLTNYLQNKNNVQIPKFEDFVQKELKIDTIDTNFASQATQKLNAFTTAANARINTIREKIKELDKKYDSLDPSEALFTADRKNAVETWLKSESLGSAFIFEILNSQLPKQSLFLKPLIEEVNFNNLAANAINDLLKITNHFSTTSVYYNLSSYLIQSKEGDDLFCGDYFETLLALTQEREYISRDLERCARATKMAEELIKKINNLPNVSDAQKSSMLNATYNYEYVISVTVNQLDMLNALLSNLTIEAKGSNNTYSDKVFKITGPKDWIPTLAALEGYIANGLPHASPAGGLGTLYTQIQSDQQDYTTQGQTQQLSLQNQMTNVQQEWTLVSTSMQVLNQILTKLVGEIYPN